MQNLKTPHSASDSPTKDQIDEQAVDHTEDETKAELANHNGQITLNDQSAELIDETEIAPDPVQEPGFLDAIDEKGDMKEPVYIPSPEESTVREPQGRARSLKLQWRFFRTLIFSAWVFFRLIFWQVYVRKYFPQWVDNTNINRWRLYARQYSNFAIKMGGVFIKLGQFISTRVDIFPEEIIKELENLQDTVPTIEFKVIQRVLERELGATSERFAYINAAPIAAASLGQVHRGKLLNGDNVVVKVQRPGIRDICFTDLAAMRVVAKVAMRFAFISRRCDAVALVEEFGRVFLEELSYKHEAYNAHRFAEIFRNNMGVYIPSVYHEHSTDQVLTLEDVTTLKINDYEALEKAGISRKAVAKRLMDTYLVQIFNEYYFHADPHPGNLFVYPLPVEDENADFGEKGRPFYLIFVDFGMTGTLTHEIADGMVSTLHAVLTRDHQALVRSYVKLGFILPGADIERIEEATKSTFDEVWGLSMTDIRDMPYDRVTDLAEEFSDLMLSMPFYIPQDFIYLGRTVSIMSGMTTSLDPSFNPWDELLPYTETLIARGFGIDIPQGKLVRESFNLSTLTGLFSGDGGQLIRTLGEEVIRRALPPQIGRADRTLQRLQEGDIHIVAELSLAHRQQLKRIEKESRRTGRSVFFGSVLISSTLLYTGGNVELAIAGYVICVLTLILGTLKE